MNTATALQLALLVIAGLLVGLGMAISARRVARTWSIARYEQRAATLRPRLMRLLSDDQPDLSSLDAFVGPEAKLLESLVWQMLPKVRGASRAALVEWLTRRGAIERARRRVHRPGTVGRGIAAEHLGAAGVAATWDDVSQLLGDRRAELRIVAARALGKLGDERAVPRLLDTFESRRPIPESIALMALIHIGPNAVEPLIEGLGRKSSRARAVCVQLLGIHGAIHAAKWIVGLAQYDLSDEVRIEAAAALGRLGMAQGVEPLVRLMSPGGPVTLRATAAQSLGQIGGPAALGALQTALHDDDHIVGRAAAEALTTLGPAGAKVLVFAAQSGGPGAVRAEEWMARASVEDETRRRRTQRIASTTARRRTGAP